MDGRLARLQLLWCWSLFLFMAPCLAYNEHAPLKAAPPLTKYALQARLNAPVTTNQAEPSTSVSPAISSSSSARASAHGLTRRNTLSFTPQYMTFNNSDLFSRLPHSYQLHIELTPSGALYGDSQRLSAYQSYQLSPQSSLGMSFKSLKPRLNFDRAGLQTSLQLRGDGIKLNFRPTAISDQLQLDVKITDDESRLDLTYKY